MSAAVRNLVFGILCVILGGALVFMISAARQEETARQEAFDQRAAEAGPYEKELNNLKAELSQMKKQVTYESDSAKMMIGFVLSDASDESRIRELAGQYGFSPVAILDCAEEEEVLLPLIDSVAENGWEIMLTASAFSEKANETVRSVLSVLDSRGLNETGVFLLRDDAFHQSNIEKLLDDGFIGYTVYNTTVPDDGQNEDGSVYFEYYYVSSVTSSVSGKLGHLRANRTSMIIAIDMAAVRSGEVPESYLASLLDRTKTYHAYEDCRYATVAEVVEELSAINEIEAANQAEYEKSAPEIETRMEELNDRIQDIWGNRTPVS